MPAFDLDAADRSNLYLPKQGPVLVGTGHGTELGVVVKASRRPTPAPPAPLESPNAGMIVVLSRIPGFTSAKVLKQPFRFQCAPTDSMPQDYSWTWDDYPTIGSGFHSNPQYRNLDTYSFSSLFVDDDWQHYNFTQIANHDVLGMVRQLKAIGDAMTPMQLNFGEPGLWGAWDVVTAVTLRSLHVEERSGEIDARYFTVTFSQYPDAPTHVLQAKASAGDRKQPPGVLDTLNVPKLPNNMRSLGLISKHYFHENSSWIAIAKRSGFKGVTAGEDLRVHFKNAKPPARVIVPDIHPVKAQTGHP